jgi:hypothetical protein
MAVLEAPLCYISSTRLKPSLIGDRDEFGKDEVGRMRQERVLQLSFGCLDDALATGGELHGF